MRLRALPLLLALTVADYALWHWSIAGGHDVLSLISGLTLLPLAAAALALLALGAARLCGAFLEGTRDRRRRSATAAGSRAHRRPNARGRRPVPAGRPTPAANADAKPPARGEERRSRRLAA